MPLTDYSPLIRPFRVIDERLIYHSADGSGRLLDGIKYDMEGKIEGKGARDYPYLQPVAFSDIETIGPGANHSRNEATQGASPAWDEQTFAFWIWAKRKHGFYARTPGSNLAVMDWVCRFRDAIETTSDGEATLDRRLEEQAAEPIQFLASQNEVTELGWGVLVEIIVQTDTYCPAGRTG